MKRLPDDNYAPVKRPFGTSRGESYGQIQNTGVGSGGQKLTTDDALQYLKEVKEMFQNQREKYDQFLDVMKDFKAQRIDTEGVIARVKELFKGHNHLIYGFNTFLPKGYEITLDEDDSPPKKVEFAEAIYFVNKIKKRFQNDDRVYKSFLEILNMYRREHKTIGEVYEEVSQLFKDHPDLLDEFTRFLPDNSASASAPHVGRSTYHRNDDRDTTMPSSRQVLYDKQRFRRDRVSTSHTDRDHSVEHPDLDEEKLTIKAQKEHRRREKDMRNRDSEIREPEHVRDSNSQHFFGRKKPARKEGYPSGSSDDRNALKSMYYQEFTFCERVKEKLGSSDDYQAFLKCLHIYSTEIITRAELQSLVADLLGKYPDLMEGFNEFLERCENIDGFLAGVISKKSLWSDRHLPRTTKADEKDKEAKRDTDAAKEKKEKYWKSIQDLDLSNCQRCTPSYRLLPNDYPIHTASQRSELGAQVLNDHWVSATSGSEDYSFKHMRRNQYEESLFRCEDDRFELDMLIESVSSTTKRAEDLLDNINNNTIKMDAPIRVEDHFTAINLRCIERLYSDHGLDVMDILCKNPALALPVILIRLKQKEEEWGKCRSDFNKVWAEIYAKNHYKSLDHRSFYFKQQDSKNLSTKFLVAEIKEMKENEQKDDGLLLFMAAAYKRPLVPHLEVHYPDIDVHEDIRKLIKYSCEEVCSTKEQLNKVMRLWYTFLEPMLGVASQSRVADNAESKTHDHTAINGEASMEIDAPQGSDAHAVNSKQLKLVANGNENELDVTKSCQTIANGNATAGELGSIESKTAHKSSDAQPSREPNDVGAMQRALDGSMVYNALSHAGAERNSGRTNVEVISGTQSSLAGPSNSSMDIQDPNYSIDVMPPKEIMQDAAIFEVANMGNGSLLEGSEINRNPEDHVGCSKSEKEEGELSPNCDSEEDNSMVCGDADMPVPVVKHGADCRPSQHGNVVDATLDNDADDEDSGNAFEAGADASGSESGDECSREEHEEEEDVDNDDLEGKPESESEADFQYFGGNKTGMSQSERFLISVKPVKKYVSSATEDVEIKDSRIFYGNDDLYVLFRLHHTLYERILTAKISSTSAEANWKNTKETNSLDPYASFMGSLYNLLDGSSDNATFEDDCRTIIGNQAYVLFTLDKLICKVVKQLQTVATDEIDSKLLQLFEYENSRTPGKFDDSVYHENTRVLLHDENIYRIECSCTPARLLIQLMDSVEEKPNVVAVSMEPNFSSYLQNDFLSLLPSKKESYRILLYRNRRKYVGLDENSAMSLAMEDVQLFNGLEHKIACSTSKIYYVLDTEDFFHRPSKRRKNLPADQSAQLNQARVQRFHKFLSTVL